MKIFLSWSGPWSQGVAEEFRKWIPYVLQSTDPFMSAEDIGLGSDWNATIKDKLLDSAVGLIFLMPDNIDSPWLNFESGALSISMEKKRKVIPILFEREEKEIILSNSPLKQFQSVITPDESGIRKLMIILNAELDIPLQPDILDKTFEQWWPLLSGNLDKLQTRFQKSNAVEEDSGETNFLLQSEILVKLDSKVDKLMRGMDRESFRSVERQNAMPPQLINELFESYVRMKKMYDKILENEEYDELEYVSIFKSMSRPLKYLLSRNSYARVKSDTDNRMDLFSKGDDVPF